MTQTRLENPLIIQGDQTVLIEVDSPRYEEARDRLARFAELVKSPEHIHTYRLSPLSIWNACAAGIEADWIAETLREFSKFAVPDHVLAEIREYANRYGRIILLKAPEDELVLQVDERILAEEIAHYPQVARFLGRRISPLEFAIDPVDRGRIKQALIKMGFPAEDLAGYTEGEPLPISLREKMLSGEPFHLRHYQQDAAHVFHAGGTERGGSGVIVLPCGAGKTIVGLASMALTQTSTLILTTGVTASRQWIAEILDKSHLEPGQICEYNGTFKDIRPVTVATYNIMTYRQRKDGDYPHLRLFNERNWGLIIYDEVHLLPAPVFQITAGLQARRRLGLTATLVREDGLEEDVFALIGPKKVDVPWKVLEGEGWIAKAVCREVRLSLPNDEMRMEYAVAPKRAKFRIAAENPRKIDVVRHILDQHPGKPTLIIGMYLDQIHAIADGLDVAVLTGATPQKKRDEIYAEFREGRRRILAVSKIANFAVDLPDAAVAIQVSGSFGSRQEEAQRLGRILRPKRGENQAHFYSVVTRDSEEQEFAHHRQLFLCEQGYQYEIIDMD